MMKASFNRLAKGAVTALAIAAAPIAMPAPASAVEYVILDLIVLEISVLVCTTDPKTNIEVCQAGAA